jgi:hypothetical protein
MNPITPQEIKYCVVCDAIMTSNGSEKTLLCSEECRVTFSDFEVLYSFKECTHCCQPVTNDGDESEFCSKYCSQTHEYPEHLRASCVQCDLKMPEPITSKFCGELCEKQFALDRQLDEQERYIEGKRQDHVDEDRDDY